MLIQVKAKRVGSRWYAGATGETRWGPVTLIASADETTVRRALSSLGTIARGAADAALSPTGSASIRDAARVVARSGASERSASVAASPLGSLLSDVVPGARGALADIAEGAHLAGLSSTPSHGSGEDDSIPLADGADIAERALRLHLRAAGGDSTATRAIGELLRRSEDNDRAAMASGIVRVASRLPLSTARAAYDALPAFASLLLSQRDAVNDALDEESEETDEGEDDWSPTLTPDMAARWLQSCAQEGADCSPSAVGPALADMGRIHVLTGAASSDPAIRKASLSEAIRITRTLVEKGRAYDAAKGKASRMIADDLAVKPRPKYRSIALR